MISKLKLIKEWHQGIGFYPNDRDLDDEHKKMASDLGEIMITIGILKQERAKFGSAIREIYEVWAGSDAVEPLTVIDAYQQHLIEEMRDIALSIINLKPRESNEHLGVLREDICNKNQIK